MSRPGGGGGPPGQQQQPLSFKTIPGRNRTQKWQQAKTYNYDGDDWGGYDPYDEYGGQEEQARTASQQAPGIGSRVNRQNSFDAGIDNETRQFSSASTVIPYEEEPRTRGREFSNPAHVPAPLSMNTRSSQHPPRESSLREESPAPEVAPTPAVKADKPLPFIRPSDIYKRMAEEKERERQSMDSSRPSMDSLQREHTTSSPPLAGLTPVRSRDTPPSSTGRRPSLDPVSEGMESANANVQPSLSPVSERPTSNERVFQGFKVDNPVLARALGASVGQANASDTESGAPTSPYRSSFETDNRPTLPQVGFLSNLGLNFDRPRTADSEGHNPSSGFGASTSAASAATAALAGRHTPQDPSQNTPFATRAPSGADPAGDILAERQHGAPVGQLGRAAYEDPSGLSHQPRSGFSSRAPAGSDPAADILAERQHAAPVEQLGRGQYEDPSGLSNRPEADFQTRAPSGSNPAADILAERQHGAPVEQLGRAPHEDPSGLSNQSRFGFGNRDPAAEILAERQHGAPVEQLGRAPHEDPSGMSHQPRFGRDAAAGILAERQHGAPVEQLGRAPHEDPSGLSNQSPSALQTRAPAGSDPAAELLAERQHGAPVEQLGRAPGEDPSRLSHQPSSGFRSVVNMAFNRKDDDSVPPTPVSRDNSQSYGSMSRSDTNSTSSISPIMSRAVSAATPAQRDANIPPIAEELSTPRASLYAPAQRNISRKPSPSHSPQTSAEIAGFEPGFRRSVDTPSPNNSPARTPGLENVDHRRLSGPLAAERMGMAETPDVDPTAPEMPGVTLQPAETPVSERGGTEFFDGASGAPGSNDLSGISRDYSLREADLAQTAGSSHERSPAMGQAEKASQEQFLDSHPAPSFAPTITSIHSLSPSSPVAGSSRPTSALPPRATTPLSGRASPVTTPGAGRVRAIVDQFHEINDASRRNSSISVVSSKSSWSQFRNSSENLPATLARKGTAESGLDSETEAEGVGDESHSFPSQAGNTLRASPGRPQNDRLESFRPQLPGGWVSYAPTPGVEQPPAEEEAADDMLDAPPTPKGLTVARPDEEVDLTPTTKKVPLRSTDFANEASPSNPLFAAKSAGEALGAALMSTVGIGHQTRDFASKEPAQPVDQPETRPRVASGNLFNNRIPLPALRRELSDAPTEGTTSVANSVPPTPPEKDTPQPGPVETGRDAFGSRPISSYFTGAVPPPPLRLGANLSPPNSADTSSSRPKVLPSLSTDTTASDMESDRLRKDIVRSLDPAKKEAMKRESILEDVERTQEALDAPGNQRRIAAGETSASARDARQGLPSLASSSKPGTFLDKRFSWENRSQGDSGLLPPIATVGELDEDKERMSYERPRSSQGLHVINAEVDSIASEPTPAEERAAIEPAPLFGGAKGLSAQKPAALPVADSPEHVSSLERGDMAELSPDPVADDEVESHVPSHYAGVADPDAEGEKEILQGSPSPPIKDAASPTSPSAAAAGTERRSSATSGRIPPFREILAIKSTSDRIQAYDSTRNTFAGINTGLSDWLSDMLGQHPEHANLNTGMPPSLQSLSSTARGHRHNPSILKITRQFTSAGNGGSSYATADPNLAGEGGSRVDIDRVQAKGKDLMKKTGVLGGKAQAGAKGLLAKGRSRFGRSDKAPPFQTFDTATTTTAANTDVVSPSPILSSIAPFQDYFPTDTTSSFENHLLPSSARNDTLSGTATPASYISATTPLPRSTTATPSTPGRTTTPGRDLPTTAADFHSTSAAASRTQTPVVQEGRPTLAQERRPSFFGRLRSLSRSGTPTTTKARASSRSKSRPSSLVLLDFGGTNRVGSRPGSSGILFDGSAIEGTTPLEISEEKRKETWEEKGFGVADAKAARDKRHEDEGEEEKREVARLGVLPSPTHEKFEEPVLLRRGSDGFQRLVRAAGDDGYFGGDRREDVAVRDGGEGEVGAAETHDAPKVAEEDDGGLAGTTADEASELGKQVPGSVFAEPEKVDPDPVAPEETKTPAPIASTPERPQQSRKVSAITTLPSQQRILSLGTATPPKPKYVSDEEDLYASTPIAGRPPWRLPALETQTFAGAQQDDSAEQTPVTTQPLAPARSVSPVNARQDVFATSGNDAWEKHSVVSAAEEQRDVSEGRDDREVGRSASRRSSVSSLGSPDHVVAPSIAKRQSVLMGQAYGRASMVEQGPAAPSESTNALPPLGDVQQQPVQRSMSTRETDQEERFANRTYRPYLSQIDRPMSWMMLERDSHGVGQDRLDMANEQSGTATPVDISAFAGPPPGAPPFQQHPAMRNSQILPAEYDAVRSPPPGTLHSPIPAQESQQSNSAGDRTSRRLSGFFRSRPPSSAAEGPSGLPPPNHISDQYGIEDAQVNALTANIMESQQSDAKQTKRRSGIWDAFKRSPSVSNAALGQYSSTRPTTPSDFVPDSAPMQQQNLAGRPKTLKKPQRASSSAAALNALPAVPVAAEPKKKRFSGLGSIFGRSSTQGRNTPKPNKLTKSQQPSREASQSRPAGLSGPPTAADYEAYEAMRRQQIPDLGTPQPSRNVSTPASVSSSPYARQQEVPAPRIASSPSGYPDGQPDSRMSSPPPQMRRLHSEGFRRFNNVPESFRPVDASYNRPVMPIGPPQEPSTPSSDYDGQVRGPQMAQRMGPGSAQQVMHSRQTSYSGYPAAQGQPTAHHRQASYGSMDNALSLQTTGQSGYNSGHWDQQQRGAMPAASPAQSRSGWGGYGDTRPPAYETARSPVQEHPNQQTPWAISMPPGQGGGDGSQRSSRASSWSMQGSGRPPPSQQYPPPHAAYGRPSGPQGYTGPQGYNMAPMTPQTPAGSATRRHYPPLSMPQQYQQQQQPRPPYTGYDRQMYDVANVEQGNTYPSSPPYSPETSQGPRSPQQYPPQPMQTAGQYYQQRAPRPAPKPRYYGQLAGGNVQQQQQQQHEQYPPTMSQDPGRPLPYQRTPSGVSGRRDDMAVSEQEFGMGMRGASYPGQEWSPT